MGEGPSLFFSGRTNLYQIPTKQNLGKIKGKRRIPIRFIELIKNSSRYWEY